MRGCGRSSTATRSPCGARKSVFGWTIGNDVSARTWQHEDRSFWRSKN
ncbi:fumarylacetoacetate hydrolase family protein, partial [Streptomyces prunicolor]